MININITGADAAVTQTETLTAGRVGLECSFTFDSAWDGLSKIAVCEGADTRSVVMDGNTIIVPWECLADPGYKLRVGVRGENSSGDIVIPTVWARVGKIEDSPGDDVDPGQEATPSVVQQIQETAANALYIARGVRADADSGAFNGKDGEDGADGADGVSPTVTTEITYYGNKVTFTDAEGDHTINVLDGMTATVKSALLNLFQHVAYVDDQGQTYYDALYDAFNPVLNVDYITVVFDPGTAVIYNTDELAQLRPYLTVTAHYDDGTSATVDTYTLSGTLATGTSTITATYGGKSAIFTVTVAEWLVSIDAVFTQGSAVIYDTDTLDTLKQYLVVTATYADSTTATVADYTLSGTLEVGTSTITASYGGKTDTFNVTVTEYVDQSLLYSIQNTSISGTNTINTNVKLYDTDKDFTIAFDADVTSCNAIARFVDGLQHSSPWQGVLLNKVSGKSTFSFRYMDNYQTFGSVPGSPFRLRFVITHTAGSGSAAIKLRTNDNSAVSKSVSGTHGNKNATIYIGTWETTNSDFLWSGTVNSFYLYSRVFDSTEINDYLGV